MARKKVNGYISLLVIGIIIAVVAFFASRKAPSKPVIFSPESGDYDLGEPIKVDYKVADYEGGIDVLFAEKENGRTIKEHTVDRINSYQPDQPVIWTPNNSFLDKQGKIVIRTDEDQRSETNLIGIVKKFKADFSIEGFIITADEIYVDQEFEVYYDIEHNAVENQMTNPILQITGQGFLDRKGVGKTVPVVPNLPANFGESVTLAKKGKYTLEGIIGNRDSNPSNNRKSVDIDVLAKEKIPPAPVNVREVELVAPVYETIISREYCGPRGRVTPAVYETKSERVFVKKDAQGRDVFRTETKRVLVTPEQIERVEIPSNYRTVAKQVEVKKGTFKKETATLVLSNRDKQDYLLTLSYNEGIGPRLSKTLKVPAGKKAQLVFPEKGSNFLLKLSKQESPKSVLQVIKVKDVWKAEYSLMKGKLQLVK